MSNCFRTRLDQSVVKTSWDSGTVIRVSLRERDIYCVADGGNAEKTCWDTGTVDR